MGRTRLLSLVMVVLAGLVAIAMLALLWRDGSPILAGVMGVLVLSVLVWFVLQMRRRPGSRAS